MPRPLRAQKPTVVGALRFTSHAPTFVAKQRGYFEEAGLDVDLKFFQAAQPMAVAIASGDADYAVTAITGGLISLADKGAVTVIGGALKEEQGIEGQKILASNQAYANGLTDPSKLDGKSFGMTQAGSSFHYMGSQVAKQEGVELSFKPLQKVGAIIGAIKTGQIDAWSIVPHIAKALSSADAVKVIGEIADYLPDYQVTTVFTSPENAQRQRARTKAFLTAYARGAADYNAALVDRTEGEQAAEAMVRLIHSYVYTDRSYEKAAPSIRAGAMRISREAALNVTSVERQLSWFKSENLVPAGITMDRLVDTSYVETY
jgi:NitT/TauT family transport system substrate-binding protein